MTKKFILLFIALLLLTGCGYKVVRIQDLQKSGDIDVDIDANDAIDVVYGGTNAKTAAGARTSLGVPANSDLTTHTGNTSNPHAVTYDQVNAAPDTHLTDTANPHSVTASQAGAEPDLETISQAEAEGGVSTTDRIFTALRVAQAINALAPGGIDEIIYQADCSTIINGICIDIDDGLAYYWDGDSVEQVGTGSTEDTIGWDYTPLSSAPVSPTVGKVYCADNDNWDPLSYAGATDYFVIATVTGGYSGLFDVYGNLFVNSIQLPGHASNNAALSNLGQVFVKDTQSALALHLGSNGEIAGEAQLSFIHPFSITFDPKAVCDGTFDGLALFKVGDDAPNGIIIDEWRVVFIDGDPTTEADLDLMYADSHPGRANSNIIDILDTTAGVSSEDIDTNINAGSAVPYGKEVYLRFGTPYTEENHQMQFQMWYHAEED